MGVILGGENGIVIVTIVSQLGEFTLFRELITKLPWSIIVTIQLIPMVTN